MLNQQFEIIFGIKLFGMVEEDLEDKAIHSSNIIQISWYQNYPEKWFLKPKSQLSTLESFKWNMTFMLILLDLHPWPRVTWHFSFYNLNLFKPFSHFVRLCQKNITWQLGRPFSFGNEPVSCIIRMAPYHF